MAELTVSVLVLSAPPLASSSKMDMPAMLLSNCISLWYQLRSRAGTMLLGFLAVHIRVKVLNGSISRPEYDVGETIVVIAGSVTEIGMVDY